MLLLCTTHSRVYWQMEKLFTKEVATLHSVGNKTLWISDIFHPISTKDKNRLHHFSSKVFNGIFIGHALNVGSGWTGDPLVSDAEGSRDNTATGSTSKRIKEKEEVGIHKNFGTKHISKC